MKSNDLPESNLAKVLEHFIRFFADKEEVPNRGVLDATLKELIHKADLSLKKQDLLSPLSKLIYQLDRNKFKSKIEKMMAESS